MILSLCAIFIYPVGIWLLFALLLFKSRREILKHQRTRLSIAIEFLHREYQPTIFVWELAEMLRRFILVGALVVYKQGSVEQIAYAALVALVYLAVQITATPFRKASDNFFASGCSLSIAALFLLCLLFKYSELVEIKEIRDKMSQEQEHDYEVPQEIFFPILWVACLTGVLLLGIILGIQAGVEARRARREMRAAKARRLRYKSDKEEVTAPDIPENRFHTFLSHVWGTGQDQMRVVSARCPNHVPDVHSTTRVLLRPPWIHLLAMLAGQAAAT